MLPTWTATMAKYCSEPKEHRVIVKPAIAGVALLQATNELPSESQCESGPPSGRQIESKCDW